MSGIPIADRVYHDVCDTDSSEDGQVVLYCLCEFEARGERWEDAGADMDAHLAEMTEAGA